MWRRVVGLCLSIALVVPILVATTAPIASAGSCSTTQANLTDYGSGTIKFGGSQYCGGSDVTTVQVKIHAQRCTIELFGCKQWGDVTSWSWKSRSGPGTVSDAHTLYGLACGNLYRTEAEGAGYNPGQFWHGYSQSGQTWYGC